MKIENYAPVRGKECLPVNWNKIKAVLKEAILNIDPILFACATLLSIISIVTVWGAASTYQSCPPRPKR